MAGDVSVSAAARIRDKDAPAASDVEAPGAGALVRQDPGALNNPRPLLGPDHDTFADLLSAAATDFPGQEAFVQVGERITFSEWYDQARRLAGAFASRDVKPGDIVLVGIESSIDFAVCFAAAQLCGAIASGVNTRLGRREITYILEKSSATLMVLEDNAPDPGVGPTLVRRSELVDLRRTHPPIMPYAGKPDDIAVIIWTSGTTGMPKGACFTHRNLSNAILTAGPMAAPYGRRLSSVPFAHAGFMSKAWEHIGYGMTLVITPSPWSADTTLRLMVDERVTIASAVPTQWTKLLAHPDLASADLSALAVGTIATAPASPDLIAEVSRQLGVPLIVRYSMTECPSATGTRVGDPPDTLCRTVGRPQYGVELTIVDDEMRKVPQGTVGRIALRSAAVTVGYWRDPERTAELLMDDGRLLTGDYGWLDSDGNLVLAGRTSEMYIRGGYNVYPIEIERVLSEMPTVAAVAVVGVPAPVIGETGVAFVVPADPDHPPTLAEVRAKIRSELADYKAPDELVLVDALPTTPMMKVDKVALKTRAANLGSTRG